jgi:hypothetical protein
LAGAAVVVVIFEQEAAMSKRRLIWTGLILMAMTGGGLWLVLSGGEISESDFERIQKGMTENDVTAVLGIRPNLHHDDRSFHPLEFKLWGDLYTKYRQSWWGRTTVVSVYFGDEGKAMGATWTRIEYYGEGDGGGFFDSLRRRLGL